MDNTAWRKTIQIEKMEKIERALNEKVLNSIWIQ